MKPTTMICQVVSIRAVLDETNVVRARDVTVQSLEDSPDPPAMASGIGMYSQHNVHVDVPLTLRMTPTASKSLSSGDWVAVQIASLSAAETDQLAKRLA